MTRPISLEFQIYLEGVLLPCQPISVEVSSTSFAPAQATVAIPPMAHDLVMKLQPRMHVAVFFRRSGGDAPWNLIFEGEIHGYGRSQSADGNSGVDLILQSLDEYWASTYAMQFKSAQSLVSSNLQDSRLVFATAGETLTTTNVNGSATVPLVPMIKSVLGDETDASFPEIYGLLLQHVRKLSRFFKETDDRLRFIDRLAYVKDDDIAALVTPGHAAEIAGETFMKYPQDATLMAILRSMMEPLFYAYQSLAIPALVDDRIRQFLLAPSVPFVAPPRCNTFFPTKKSAWSFRRIFTQEPTRVRLSLMPAPGADGSIQLHYYSPRQLKEIADRMLADPESVTMEGLLLSDPALPPESREDIKGVIPFMETLSSMRIMGEGFQSDEERDTFFSSLASHELFVAQHRSRILSAQGPFNPYPVCGFPGVVIDAAGVIFGNVSSVSHTLHSAGTASTSITMDTCREEDHTPPTSRWMNKRYTDPARLEATYEALFGKEHGSLLGRFVAPGGVAVGGQTSQMDTAKRLRSLYDRSDSREVFEDAYTQRPLVTLAAYIKFMKVRQDGSRNLVGGPFRPDFAAIAKQVAQNLSSVVQDRS